MRIAAIDIGTNSIHMIVAEVRPDGSFVIVDREKEMVRLGSGGLDGRALGPEAIAAGLEALARFARLAEARGVEEIHAVATSAVREASNGGEFLAKVGERTGIRPRVISGLEEARLIYQAAMYGVDATTGTTVVIDAGGGTTEISVGDAGGVHTGRSFKLGVIRLTDGYVRTDPLSKSDERRLVRHIKSELGEPLARIAADGFDRVVATSGTMLSLGEVALHGTVRFGGDMIRHARLPAKLLHRVRKQLVAADIRARLRTPGLDSRRADLAVAGAILADTIVRLLGAREITLCDVALREGLVLDFIARNRRHIVQTDRYPDIRRRSVMELGDRSRWDVEHAQQVARLSLSLFDQTRPIHALDERAREYLEFAALLHDIGTHIAYARHHRHSDYLIRNGGLRGFEPFEVRVIGLIARHHRRGRPKKTDADFAALPAPLRRVVRVASAVLRIAECLDRSHGQCVERVEWTDDGRDACLRLHSKNEAELEIWAARRQVKPLAAELDRRIRFEVGDSHARNAEHAPPVPGAPVRRRGHRRIGQDDPARTAGQVVGGRRAAGVRH